MRKKHIDVVMNRKTEKAIQAADALLQEIERHKQKMPIAPLENEIRAVCQELADFLVEKNRAYGNSAAEPVAIFAKRLDRLAQIDVRIDDKLSRTKNGTEFPGDDTVKDLAGYLILRIVVSRIGAIRKVPH
jgi:hypothetical protein